MGHIVRIQVMNKTKTGVPADHITNTWYFDGGELGATPADVANDSAGLLATFYAAISSNLSSVLEDLWYWTAYNMADAEPRIPVANGTFAAPVSQVAGQDYPAEVAVCLSFHAAYQSGEPKARRRGRIFLGPVAESAAEIVNNVVRPKASWRTAICNAAEAMRVAGDTDKFWAVYSPTADAAGDSLDDATNDVVGGWVDNAFDIQRSRGQAATARTTFNGG
jgi:hypothetical protein